jgi:DNA polymerase elongation subunit (family B)
MTTLIVDIATVGEEWDSFDNTTKTALTKWIQRQSSSKKEYTKRLGDLKKNLGFSPVTGEIATLGVYDINRAEGTVYYVTDDQTAVTEQVGSFKFKPRSEQQILTEFWDGITSYDVIVTYGGRSFTVPYILHRSVAHDVMPTVDLMRYRYIEQQSQPYHIDLQDQLTYYGAMGKRPPLHLFCRAYGIAGTVPGHEMQHLQVTKQFRRMAEHTASKVEMVVALYEKWRTHLAPPLFRTHHTKMNF